MQLFLAVQIAFALVLWNNFAHADPFDDTNDATKAIADKRTPTYAWIGVRNDRVTGIGIHYGADRSFDHGDQGDKDSSKNVHLNPGDRITSVLTTADSTGITYVEFRVMRANNVLNSVMAGKQNGNPTPIYEDGSHVLGFSGEVDDNGLKSLKVLWTPDKSS